MASSLDRTSIYAALKARHTYGTTGNRCLLDVRLQTGDGRSAMMGDIIKAGDVVPRLLVRTTGTAPVESVEVRNGMDVLKTVRSYSRADLGRRIKVVWSGAEVRGRARKVDWAGSLTVKGNTIRSVQPINFWNADKPLRHVSRTRAEWESITTGGIAGCILELTKPAVGEIVIETQQGKMTCKLGAIGLTRKVRRFGGVRKQLEVYRLPDRLENDELAFELPIKRLREGDNPIYVRMLQEDGHMAWSSPIYLSVKGVLSKSRSLDYARDDKSSDPNCLTKCHAELVEASRRRRKS